MKNQSKPQDMLRRAALYCTAGRVAVLTVLARAEKPLTGQQIAARLGRERLDKVTIYRALECFVRAGLVHKAYTHNRAWHFELAHNCAEDQCHPHFTCTDCGNTLCVTGVSLPLAKSPGKGFVVHRQQVRLEGLCPACA